MRVVDVVKNSIWYDPRVRKQIDSYRGFSVEIIGVGVKDARENKTEIERLGCQIFLSDPFNATNSRLSFFGKILREMKTNSFIRKTVIKLNPDVIHANDLNALIPCYKAFRILRKKNGKVRLIYDTHEIFLENPWINRRKIIKRIWAFYEKHIIKKVSLVVCVSHAAKSYFLKKYGIECMVVTNSVRKKDIMTHKTLSNTVEVLNQGQFYEGRGYELMIDTAASCNLENVLFVIRGLGPLEAKLKAKKEGLSVDNVVFPPPVKTSELILAASSSSIGVAITENISKNFLYSVSNKIFEYCAAGLPVIMSDIPEHRLLNDKYKFGIILKENTPKSFLRAISAITKTKENYELLSKNAINMAEQTSWDQEFKKIIDFIKNEIQS